MPCFEMHEIKLGSLNHKLRLQDETQDGKSVKSNANKIKIWGNFIQTLISWIIWGLVDWFKHILSISEVTGWPRNYVSSQWADNVSVMFVLRLLLIREISRKWMRTVPNFARQPSEWTTSSDRYLGALRTVITRSPDGHFSTETQNSHNRDVTIIVKLGGFPERHALYS